MVTFDVSSCFLCIRALIFTSVFVHLWNCLPNSHWGLCFHTANQPKLLLSLAVDTQLSLSLCFQHIHSVGWLPTTSNSTLTKVRYCCSLTNVVPSRPLYQNWQHHRDTCPDYQESQLWFLATDCHATLASQPLPLDRPLSEAAELKSYSVHSWGTSNSNLGSVVQVTKWGASSYTYKTGTWSSFLPEAITPFLAQLLFLQARQQRNCISTITRLNCLCGEKKRHLPQTLHIPLWDMLQVSEPWLFSCHAYYFHHRAPPEN